MTLDTTTLYDDVDQTVTTKLPTYKPQSSSSNDKAKYAIDKKEYDAFGNQTDELIGHMAYIDKSYVVGSERDLLNIGHKEYDYSSGQAKVLWESDKYGNYKWYKYDDYNRPATIYQGKPKSGKTISDCISNPGNCVLSGTRVLTYNQGSNIVFGGSFLHTHIEDNMASQHGVITDTYSNGKQELLTITITDPAGTAVNPNKPSAHTVDPQVSMVRKIYSSSDKDALLLASVVYNNADLFTALPKNASGGIDTTKYLATLIDGLQEVNVGKLFSTDYQGIATHGTVTYGDVKDTGFHGNFDAITDKSMKNVFIYQYDYLGQVMNKFMKVFNDDGTDAYIFQNHYNYDAFTKKQTGYSTHAFVLDTNEIGQITKAKSGQVYQNIDTRDKTNVITYDSLGRKVSTVMTKAPSSANGVKGDPVTLQSTVEYLTNKDGNTTTQVAKSTDMQGNVAEYTYYPNGLVNTVKYTPSDAKGTDGKYIVDQTVKTLSYAYDKDTNQMTGLTQTDVVDGKTSTSTIDYTYNGLGLQATVTHNPNAEDPSLASTTSYEYNDYNDLYSKEVTTPGNDKKSYKDYYQYNGSAPDTAADLPADFAPYIADQKGALGLLHADYHYLLENGIIQGQQEYGTVMYGYNDSTNAVNNPQAWNKPFYLVKTYHIGAQAAGNATDIYNNTTSTFTYDGQGRQAAVTQTTDTDKPS